MREHFKCKGFANLSDRRQIQIHFSHVSLHKVGGLCQCSIGELTIGEEGDHTHLSVCQVIVLGAVVYFEQSIHLDVQVDVSNAV